MKNRKLALSLVETDLSALGNIGPGMKIVFQTDVYMMDGKGEAFAGDVGVVDKVWINPILVSVNVVKGKGSGEVFIDEAELTRTIRRMSILDLKKGTKISPTMPVPKWRQQGATAAKTILGK